LSVQPNSLKTSSSRDRVRAGSGVILWSSAWLLLWIIRHKKTRTVEFDAEFYAAGKVDGPCHADLSRKMIEGAR
jgi:hypothetical protein